MEKKTDINILWFTVSNVFWKSKNTLHSKLLVSSDVLICSLMKVFHEGVPLIEAGAPPCKGHPYLEMKPPSHSLKSEAPSQEMIPRKKTEIH